jgi:hypothetical protein
MSTRSWDRRAADQLEGASSFANDPMAAFERAEAKVTKGLCQSNLRVVGAAL